MPAVVRTLSPHRSRLAANRRRITTPLEQRRVPGLRLTPEHSVSEAGRLRLRCAEGSVNAESLKCYRNYVRNLLLYFGDIRLADVNLTLLRGYREARLAGGDPFMRTYGGFTPPMPCPVGEARVQNELNFLRLLLRHAGVAVRDGGLDG